MYDAIKEQNAGLATFRVVTSFGSFGLIKAVGAKLPKGFGGTGSFLKFGGKLNTGLKNAGYGDTVAYMQGSAAKGTSHQGYPFDGNPSGATSDFDIALAGDLIFSAAKSLKIPLRSGGTRTGPLSSNDLRSLGLTDLAAELNSIAGREVNFMIFDSKASAIAKESASIGIISTF